jgi:hypothetical protein
MNMNACMQIPLHNYKQSFHTTPDYVNATPSRDLMTFAVHTVLGAMHSRFACCATPSF